MDTVSGKMAAVGHVLADLAFDGGDGVGKVLGTIISEFLFEGEKRFVKALDHEHGEKEGGRVMPPSVTRSAKDQRRAPKTSTFSLCFCWISISWVRLEKVLGASDGE